ncbi:hypothetical protein ACWM0G_02010 [Weissella cibaria]
MGAEGWSAVFAAIAIVISIISFFWNQKKISNANEHLENLNIAKQTYFNTLIINIPKGVESIKYERNGGLDQKTIVNLMKNLDSLRTEIIHLSIYNSAVYVSAKKKIETIDDLIGELQKIRTEDFKTSVQWKKLLEGLNDLYIKLIKEI